MLLGDAALEAGLLVVARADRLDLLPPVRGYAQAITPPEPEELDRWCRHFLARVKALGDQAGNAASGALIERLKPEVPNLEAAFIAVLTEALRPVAVAASYGHQTLLSFTGLGRTAASPGRCLPQGRRRAGRGQLLRAPRRHRAARLPQGP